MINKLPQENIVPETIRFFKHYIWLNSYYFISSDNIFSINSENKAVLAKYNLSHPKPIILIVEYLESGKAKTVWNKLAKIYKFRNALNTAIEKDKKENTFFGFDLSDQFITAVFQAAGKADVEELLNKLKS